MKSHKKILHLPLKNESMKFFYKLIIIITLLIFTQIYSYAQFYKSNENWSIGFQIGMNTFWGDVSDQSNHIIPSGPFQKDYYKNHGIVGSFYLSKEITNFWTMRLLFRTENLKSTDLPNNYKFISPLNFEFGIMTTIDILDLANVGQRWDFYPMFGLTAFCYKTTLYNLSGDTIIAHAPDKYRYTGEQKYDFKLAIPVGLGVNFKATQSFHIHFETIMTCILSDAVDGIKIKPKTFEGIWHTHIGFTYNFSFRPIATNYRRHSSYSRNKTSNTAIGADANLQEYKNTINKGNVSSWNGRTFSSSSSTQKVKSNVKRNGFKLPKK